MAVWRDGFPRLLVMWFDEILVFLLFTVHCLGLISKYRFSLCDVSNKIDVFKTVANTFTIVGTYDAMKNHIESAD